MGAPPITADERIELEQLRSSNETLKEKIASRTAPKKAKDESEDSYDEEHESSDSEVS